MYRYVLKRLVMMIPVLFGISFFLFIIMDLAPGNTVVNILGENATQEAVDELTKEMGLDQPVLVRYVKYMLGVVQGDFGTSYRTQQPVFNEIVSRFPATVKLAVGGVLLMILLGLPIGIISAVKQYSIIDNGSLLMALLCTSMPGFWLGMMLMLLFSLRLGWLPASYESPGSIESFILPCITVMASLMASLVRMTRSNMLEVLKQDYIQMARAKGASEKQIIWRHALRNALLPIVTIIGLNFSSLLGGTMIIESVFSIPGLGSLMITSIRQKDTPVVMAAGLFLAVMGSCINLLVDVLYAYIDPRLKSQYTRKSR